MDEGRKHLLLTQLHFIKVRLYSQNICTTQSLSVIHQIPFCKGCQKMPSTSEGVSLSAAEVLSSLPVVDCHGNTRVPEGELPDCGVM